MNKILLLSALIVVLLVPTAAIHVNAQMPPGVPNIPNMPKEVSGKYVNSDAGVEIVFPDGWSGFETNMQGSVTVMMMLGDPSAQSESNFVSIMLMIADKKPSETTPPPPPTDKKVDCKVSSSTTVKLSGVNAAETVMECTGEVSMKMKSDQLQTDKKWISVMYNTSPSSNYDSHIAEFDSSVQTLKVAKAIDMSVTTPAANLEIKSHMQKVKATGNDIDLDVQSSSSITDFTFSETDKKISFKVSGPDGTDGTTVIPVSKVLQGPYTVTFDGNAMTDFQTMTSPTGDVSIKLAYKHPTHVVTITGTSVVPEFPAISALILAVSFLAIIGFTVAARRSKVWALVP